MRAQGNRSEIPGEDRVRPLCEEGMEEGDDRRARAVSGRAQRSAGERAVRGRPGRARAEGWAACAGRSRPRAGSWPEGVGRAGRVGRGLRCGKGEGEGLGRFGLVCWVGFGYFWFSFFFFFYLQH